MPRLKKIYREGKISGYSELGEMGEWQTANRFLLGKTKNALKLDCGNSCTIWEYIKKH